MPRFFVSENSIDAEGKKLVITGEEARHISHSLRADVGDRFIVCDGKGSEYECVASSFDSGAVYCDITAKRELTTEPPFDARIYQALPKGDKLDYVIQKSVECGASSLVTFESEFCVAREKADSAERKLDRRRKIALEAAKQCGRGIIPEISPTLSFKEAVLEAAKADIPIFCYEGEGTEPLSVILETKGQISSKDKPTVSVVIGSEGGFSPAEADFAKKNGMLMAGLGGRILRSETVAGFVLACLVYEFEL